MTTSANYDRAAFAHKTSEVLLTLLELDGEDLGAPIRVVNNKEDITHLGNVYQGFPFFVKKPTNLPHEMPRAELSVCNVDRMIVDAVRDVDSPLTVTITQILASDLDTIEDGPYSLILRDVGFNYGVVFGSLMVDDILNEPYPADTYDPVVAPGLF
jgi:hypothetical protein